MVFVCRFIFDGSFGLVVVVVVLIFYFSPFPQDHFFLSQIVVVVFCPPGLNHWEAGFYKTARASFPVTERV